MPLVIYGYDYNKESGSRKSLNESKSKCLKSKKKYNWGEKKKE